MTQPIVDAEGVPGRDGRTARRDRNRDAVLDALIELFIEDAVYPGPAQVAERSGVSLRSVYRYFEDMDALAQAAMARHLARILPLFVVEGIGQGEVADRVERLVDQRLRLFAAAAPIMRAALVRATTSEVIGERVRARRADLLAQVEAMFAPEVERLGPVVGAEVVAAVDVLLEFEAVEHLSLSRGLSTDEIRSVLVRAVGAVVGGV